MKKSTKIIYWSVTSIIALLFITGGISDLSHSAQMVAGMRSLGYPDYFMNILGVAKLLGAVALIVPKYPRLKDWAYAGCFFDLAGAALSHAAMGQMGAVTMPIVLIFLLMVSYFTYQGMRPKYQVAIS